MDTGLKRLWTRRKSKGTESRKDSPVSSPKKSQGAPQPPRSTPGPRYNQLRNISSAHGAPRSGLGITDKTQSKLGADGIQRPSTSWSRPATDEDGSMLNAVNRAADAVAKAEQDYQQSADRYTKDHIRPKTARYIDIFSLSSSNSPKPKPGYNEDVAERNLDVGRVALESPAFQYVPSSRYQEEVAARNALPSLPGSSTTSPSVRQGGFDGSNSPLQARGLSSALGNSPRSPQTSDDQSAFWQGRKTPNSSQGPKTVDASPKIPTRRPGRRSGEFNVHEVSTGALSGYQLSASEVTQLKSRDSYSHSHSHDYSVRSQSSLSNPSSVKHSINLPNRTILDLTGDDLEPPPEAFFAASNYSASPILGHAKIDMMRRVQGPVIPMSLPENIQIQSNSSEPATVLPSSKRPAETVETSHERNLLSSTASELPAQEKILANPPSNRMTPIITIASASPRASVVMDEIPLSRPAEDAQTNVETKESNVSHTQDEDRSSADARASDSKKLTEQAALVAELPGISDGGTVSHINMTPENGENDGTVPSEATSDRTGIPGNDLDTKPVIGPYVHLSSLVAETQPSSNGTPGVSTKDFAHSAVKPTLTSVPEDNESNSGHDAASIEPTQRERSLSTKSDRPTKHVPIVTGDRQAFDETEFAQKQNEAREALIRLQLSLNENFLIQPLASSAKSSGTGRSRHMYSFSDGRPAAPSNIFAQLRESSTSPENSRREPENLDQANAETSYHHQATMPPNQAPTEGQNGSAVHRTADQREMAKQKMPSDLDGPGPSIVTEVPKASFPLPAPLHVTGHQLYQRFQQQPPPPSPGEISLSNFPIPISSPRQSVQAVHDRVAPLPASPTAPQHQLHSSTGGVKERILRRQSSTRSQSSSTSVYSIPYHMIPDRSSSVRDRSVMEDDDE